MGYSKLLSYTWLLLCVLNIIEANPVTSTPKSTAKVVKQINRVNDDGSYTIGYEAEDGTFKIETRDTEGNVKGMFGFLDASGHVKRVSYATSNATDDLNNVSEFQPKRKPSYVRSVIRTRSPTSGLLRFNRRPLPEEETEDTPIFDMLLRKSRQGSRSDADELLRLQQQTDATDIYGSTNYQVPEVPFRQHFLQGSRGRINNAVLQHHLRQLSPEQLYEIQQYATTMSSQGVPDPTYPTRPTNPYPTSRPVAPFTPYPVSRDVYDQNYGPNRYGYSNLGSMPYYPQPHSQGRSYSFQNPNLPDELRQALIFRMLLTARLLGLDTFISRYTPQSTDSYDPYYESDQRLAFTPRYTPDPRQVYPRQPLYYQALAAARAAHARQLAAYQQQYNYRPNVDYTDDQAVLELRRQIGDPSVSPRFQYSFRATQDPNEDEFSSVTPSSSPSVSTTPSSTSQRIPTERPTPSYIQRVRSVQVLNQGTSAPRTIVSSTTRRPNIEA